MGATLGQNFVANSQLQCSWKKTPLLPEEIGLETSGYPPTNLTQTAWIRLRTGDEIFGLNFAVGVVTGVPMEFQFGTSWAGFSKYAGAVIGQTSTMEGMFAFFLQSAFIGALICGEKRLGPRNHFFRWPPIEIARICQGP